ncbi:MAG: type II methionyl aminopeptidase [Crenarchaeota archaeon]|nr:type II methionyl aminopeptidase [Thermoproteota archaeon]
MEQVEVEKLLRAGEIAARVREEAERLVKPGVPVIEICETVERRIRELGGEPAFPCNVSINQVAAHYTSPIGDESLIPDEGVVKVDIGVHVDGYIADTATTIALSPRYEGLLDAAREALERALEFIKPGTPFKAVSRLIEDVIRRKGYRPIGNLGGHSIGRYRIHAGESIPNSYEPFLPGSFKPGRVYAIEPFATNGKGVAVDAPEVYIYALSQSRLRRRMKDAEKKLLAVIASRYRTLPFTERWLSDVVGDVEQLRRILKRLSKIGMLTSYPVLVEAGRGLVSQFEHTIVVLEKEVLVTTRR